MKEQGLIEKIWFSVLIWLGFSWCGECGKLIIPWKGTDDWFCSENCAFEYHCYADHYEYEEEEWAIEQEMLEDGFDDYDLPWGV